MNEIEKRRESTVVHPTHWTANTEHSHTQRHTPPRTCGDFPLLFFILFLMYSFFIPKTAAPLWHTNSGEKIIVCSTARHNGPGRLISLDRATLFMFVSFGCSVWSAICAYDFFFSSHRIDVRYVRSGLMPFGVSVHKKPFAGEKWENGMWWWIPDWWRYWAIMQSSA